MILEEEEAKVVVLQALRAAKKRGLSKEETDQLLRIMGKLCRNKKDESEKEKAAVYPG